jgi:hypothetical protein
MAPLLIPVVTLVIALAGLVLAIFALVLIAAQRLDNAQLPARRRSERDPDDANARALFGRSDFRPRPFRMSDTEPIPKSDPITQAHRDRIRHTEAVAESYGTPAIPYPVTDTHGEAAVANADPDANAVRKRIPDADRKAVTAAIGEWYRSDRGTDALIDAINAA